jgi:hypothetical protein
MAPDSPVRQLVKGMAVYAKILRRLATTPDLQRVYDNLCDVLDALNEELRDEDEGMLNPDWQKFLVRSSAQPSTRI